MLEEGPACEPGQLRLTCLSQGRLCAGVRCCPCQPAAASHSPTSHPASFLPGAPVWRYDLRQDRGVSWEAAYAVRDEAVRRMEEAAEGEEHDHHSGFYTRAWP